MKTQRVEAEFREAQSDLTMLQQAESQGEIDLFYFDESGFMGVPVVPYAWQNPEEPICLPSKKTKRINVLGFLKRDNQFDAYTFEQSVNSSVVKACINQFIQTRKKTTVIVLDCASIHQSEDIKQQIQRWEEQDIFLYYLPKYSPELNLIEILWKQMKYYWISTIAYLSFSHLRDEVDRVLKGIGDDYKIRFTT